MKKVIDYINYLIRRLYVKYEKHLEMNKRKSVITKNFKDLEVIRKLSPKQKREIQNYYMKLIGKKVPLYSHQYFYSRTGVFNKEYVPTNIYHCELVPKANHHPYNRAYGDKNMCDVLFPDENTGHTYLKNINGYFYFEGNPVSEEDAISSCQNLGRVIIKPSLKSKGKGIEIIVINDGKVSTGQTLADLFKQYDKNYLIQDCIRQHPDMAILNPSSVNTIRILSYRSEMEVLIIYSVIRIGRKDSVIDNQSAGGISTTIDKKGRLGKYAFGGYNEDQIEVTDSGVTLEGYQIPCYDKVIDMVKRLHLRLPFFNLLGWDVAIGEDGEPVLVEFNVDPGLSQSAFRSGMGEYTERIIKELWPRKNSWF